MSTAAKAGISVAVAAAAPAVLSLAIGPLAFVMFAPFYVMALLVGGAQILRSVGRLRTAAKPVAPGRLGQSRGVAFVFNQFTEYVANASGWAYAAIFLLAMLDAILPVVPSETAVITAGVVAASGHLFLPLIVISAMVGAMAGDNLAYLIGLRFGEPATRRFFSSAKSQKRLAWAQRQLSERGGQLILVARFIPGGRTVVTLSAGLLRYPWPRFFVFDAVAALLWAVYAAALGYFGGRAFENAAWKGLLLALGTGFAVGGVVEAVRWLLHRRRGRSAPDRRAGSESRR